MNVEDKEWVKHALVEAERRECISKIVDMSWKEAVAPGNNFVSDIFRVKVNVMKNSGETEEKSVIYKIEPTSENKIQGVKEKGLFKVEARMYMETLQQMKTIFQSYEPGCEPLWPKFYGVKGDYDGCLMEDLAPSGFKGVNRRDELDYDHCKLVIDKLAKFHAGGAKILKKNPGVKKDLGSKSYFKQEIKGFLTWVTNMMPKVLINWPPEWHEYIDKFDKFNEEFQPKVLETFDEDYNMNTICHGDLWTSNILFKYNEDGQPVQLRFIDFQESFYGSPIYDLQNLFGTSIKYELGERRLELLDLYHGCLVKYLKLFEVEMDPPTFEQLLEDYEKSKPFQYHLLLAIKPIFINPSIEELEKMHGKKDNKQDSFLMVFQYQGENYLRTLKRTLTEIKEMGYLKDQ